MDKRDARGLLLAARLRTLRLSLIAVRGSLASVEESRLVLRGLLPTIQLDVYAKLREIDAAATRLMNQFELNDQSEFVETETTTISSLTRDIRKYLKDVPRGLRVIGRVHQATERALELDFLSALDTQIEATRLMLEKLSGDAGMTRADVQAAWLSQRALFVESEEFFAAYVEMLNGLAMRDAGFDNGIPAIADALIQNRIAGWSSLTIAGHKRHASPTRAKFIHLGFPEWTPWALPLAAFDFGRMEIQEAEFQSLVQQKVAEGFDREAVETCLADAIATYLVGPAYVWATMVIQLDPAAGHVGRSTGMQRVQCMLIVLRKLDDPTRPTEPVFGKVADDLADAWKAASGEVDDEIAEAPGDQPAPNTPTAIEVREFATWLSLRRFDGFRARAMKPDDWGTVRDLADALRSGDPETNDISAVLNAAWLIRTEDQLDKSGDDQPLENLRKKVTDVLSDIALRLAKGDESPTKQSPATQAAAR